MVVASGREIVKGTFFKDGSYLCVLMGMGLWRGSGRLEKGTNNQRMSLNRQRGQKQSSFHHGHRRAGSRQGLGTETE